LARQPRFRAHAEDVADRLARADVWLMHNRGFDRGFLEREFELAGRSFPDRPTYCTMRQARIQWPGQSARLDACAGRIGLGRASRSHGALEDALLTAAPFSFYHTGRRWKRLPEAGPPTNLIR
jgi:DNA polymerase III epsilon subunit-like protein